MIKQLKIKNSYIKEILCIVFLIFISFNQLFSQEIIISKTSIESTAVCNQFDVTLEIIGNPPPKPQEVVLIIDRSGSMDDGVYPEPIDYAKEAAVNFVEEIFLPENNPTGLNKISIVSYSTYATLDIGLTDSNGKQDILDAINNIITGGWTNIEDGLIKADDELTNNGTFDCSTSRNIILLTDGVATFRNGSSINCDTTTENTECQLAAIEAGVNAQTTIVNGEEYNQSIFTIGLVSALWGIEQEIALSTLEQIQNKGAFWTEDNADLSEIYSFILGQLVSAAQQLPGEALVTDTITDGFELIDGSLEVSKGIATISGQVISWYVSDVSAETITLKYSIIPNTLEVCGDQESGISVMSYIDSDCIEQTLIFENPGFCVPCSEITAEITYENCDHIINYSSELIQGNCSPVSGDFLWEFYLNNILIGTSNVPNGSYEYVGSDPFIGEFNAELTFSGTYGNGCILPDVITDESILISGFPELTVIVDPQVLCYGESTANIDLTVTNGNPPFTYLWNTGAITEDLIGVPAGVYSVLVTDDFGCSTVSSEEIIVTEPNELISTIISQSGIECTGNGSVVIETVGGTEPYIYSIDGGDYQDNGIFNSLTEGFHVINIEDANLCVNEIEFYITNKCISLIKEAVFNDENKNGCSDVGETISYSFTVINTGNVTLSNIIVSDPLVTVIGNPITSLALGESDTETFTATYQITQQDINVGIVINQAFVKGVAPDQTIITDLSDDTSEIENDPTITELCQPSSIAIIKYGNLQDENKDGCTDVGETIKYTFTVINTGISTLSNIIISDPLVAVEGGPLTTLASGESDTSTFSASYMITQEDIDSGEVLNQATVIGIAPNQSTVTDLSDDTSEFEDDPTITELCLNSEIGLIKEVSLVDENDNNCADLGEHLLYTFKVKNTGNKTLNNIQINDPLVTVLGGPITLNPLEENTSTFTAVYSIIQQDLDNGNVLNQATVDGTTIDGEVVSDSSDVESYNLDNPTVFTNFCSIIISIDIPSLSIEKAGIWNDENGNLSTDVGETISYFFSITNTGETDLFNIMIEDPLEGLILEGNTIETLLVGATDDTTFRATYTINQEDIDNGEVINQALVTGFDSDNEPVIDSSDDPNNSLNIDPNNDGEPDDPTIVILPLVAGSPDFEIFNGITPNDDGYNDFFEIRGIDQYPNNNVKIYNRWGVLIWETNGYDESQNVFTGDSDARMMIEGHEDAPTGTYFYILTFFGDEQGVDYPEHRSYSGYLYLNR